MPQLVTKQVGNKLLTFTTDTPNTPGIYLWVKEPEDFDFNIIYGAAVFNNPYQEGALVMATNANPMWVSIPHFGFWATVSN